MLKRLGSLLSGLLVLVGQAALAQPVAPKVVGLPEFVVGEPLLGKTVLICEGSAEFCFQLRQLACFQLAQSKLFKLAERRSDLDELFKQENVSRAVSLNQVQQMLAEPAYIDYLLTGFVKAAPEGIELTLNLMQVGDKAHTHVMSVASLAGEPNGVFVQVRHKLEQHLFPEGPWPDGPAEQEVETLPVPSSEPLTLVVVESTPEPLRTVLPTPSPEPEVLTVSSPLPSLEPVLPEQVPVRLNQALQLYQQKQLPQAKILAQQVLKVSPQEVLAWTIVGNVQLLEGEFKAADASFSQVLGLQPDHLAAHFNRVIARYKSQQPDLALADLDALLLRYPSQYPLWFSYRAQIHADLGYCQAMQEDLQRACQLNPEECRRQLVCQDATKFRYKDAPEISKYRGTISTNH